MKKISLLMLAMWGLTLSYAEADRLVQPTVDYEKRPSGRFYGSDGSMTDPKPSAPNKVYDDKGRAYHSNVEGIGRADTLATPLPRNTVPVGRSSGVRMGVGGVRR